MLYKDAVLNGLAARANVAQFVSFGADAAQRFCWIRGHSPNHDFNDLRSAVTSLLEASGENSINVRSYDPASPKSKEFIYGIKNIDDATSAVERLASQGLFTIVNETIDVRDGGVSGIALGDLIEFMPGETPRAVEKLEPASLPRSIGVAMLHTVYGFVAELDYSQEERVEFSIHPMKRGYKGGHTIIWELENIGSSFAQPRLSWPNPFSQFIGDKAYGLLVAHLFGLPVPRTTVFARSTPPFSFGRATGSTEVWMRTCPRVQQPGKYTTRKGWTDPFRLMSEEDPDGLALASLLVQSQVDARFSGALSAVEAAPGETNLMIEGVPGFGDEFMIGSSEPAALPATELRRLRTLFRMASAKLGPVRFEWASDEKRAWILQLHRGLSASNGHVIYPGSPVEWLTFHVADGLDSLRRLIASAQEKQSGITVEGRVGVTSHVGDLLRKARVPSVLSDP
jgi:hypothetical protein